MTEIIICVKDSRDYSKLYFYYENEGQRYYLFGQHYTTEVFKTFNNGCKLKEALSFENVKGTSLKKVKEKLPKYLAYIEKEYELTILQKTKDKVNKKFKNKKAA